VNPRYNDCVTVFGGLPGSCSVSHNPRVVAGVNNTGIRWGNLDVGRIWIAEQDPDGVYRIVYHSAIAYGDTPLVSPDGQRVFAINANTGRIAVFSKVGGSWSGVRWAPPFPPFDTNSWYLSYDGSLAYSLTSRAVVDLVNLSVVGYVGGLTGLLLRAGLKPGELRLRVDTLSGPASYRVGTLRIPLSPPDYDEPRGTIPASFTVDGVPLSLPSGTSSAAWGGYTDASGRFMWVWWWTDADGYPIAVVFDLLSGSVAFGKLFRGIASAPGERNYRIQWIVPIPSGYLVLVYPSWFSGSSGVAYVYNSAADVTMTLDVHLNYAGGPHHQMRVDTGGVVWLYVRDSTDGIPFTKIYRIPPPYTSIIPWQVELPQSVTIPPGPDPWA